MSQLYTTPVALAMQPAVQCGAFPNEEFVDFESAHQYSITSEDWALSELEEAALAMEQKTLGGGGCKARPEVKKVSPTESVPAASSCSPRAVAVMKASMLEASDDDLFGSGGQTRNYSSSFNKTRPTMISAKYRLKEERRKVLKISINKLKKIEDPENSLRRSVLINNTMKRLQREAREERREKQQLHSFPRYTPSYKSFVMREEPPKPAEEQAKPSETAPSAVARLKPDADKENASPYPAAERKHPSAKTATTLESCFCDETMDELVDVTSLDEELSRPLEELANPVNHATASIEDVAARCSSRKRSFDEDVRPLEALSSLMDSAVVVEDAEAKGHHHGGGDDAAMDVDATRAKRSYEDVEDAEIHDVLSQFYMPPTPRMLTSIDDDDEDEEVNVVDIDNIDMPLSRGLSTIVTKTIGFEELVRDELEDEPVTLAKRLSEELAGGDLSPPCKRPRFEAGSSMHATAAPVFGGATHAAVERMYGDASVLGKSQSFGFLAAEMVAEFGDKLSRDVAAVRTSPEASLCSGVGSANCGTVGTSLPALVSDSCTATSMGGRGDVEIKDMKNLDFATKESKTVDRRSQITSISEVISWTSLMADARAESQDYKYNTELCKTLSDCCYNQETNNNLAVEPNKLSCAHAAITELQSQVYHNYATSLES